MVHYVPVGEMIGLVFAALAIGYLAGDFLGFSRGYSAGRRYELALRLQTVKGKHVVNHESREHNEFTYTPVYSQDDHTAIFPLLLHVDDTTEIPVTDFDSLLIHNRKGI